MLEPLGGFRRPSTMRDDLPPSSTEGKSGGPVHEARPLCCTNNSKGISENVKSNCEQMPTNKNTRRSSQRRTGNRKKKSNQAQVSVEEASLSNIDDKIREIKEELRLRHDEIEKELSIRKERAIRKASDKEERRLRRLKSSLSTELNPSPTTNYFGANKNAEITEVKFEIGTWTRPAKQNLGLIRGAPHPDTWNNVGRDIRHPTKHYRVWRHPIGGAYYSDMIDRPQKSNDQSDMSTLPTLRRKRFLPDNFPVDEHNNPPFVPCSSIPLVSSPTPETQSMNNSLVNVTIAPSCGKTKSTVSDESIRESISSTAGVQMATIPPQIQSIDEPSIPRSILIPSSLPITKAKATRPRQRAVRQRADAIRKIYMREKYGIHLVDSPSPSPIGNDRDCACPHREYYWTIYIMRLETLRHIDENYAPPAVDTQGSLAYRFLRRRRRYKAQCPPFVMI